MLHSVEPGPDAALPRNLVAEANHRIANSLAAVAALVHKQASNLPLEEQTSMPAGQVRRLLGEVRSRIDAVSRLHRILSSLPAEAPIDLGTYLQQIAAEVVSTLARPGSTALHFTCELGVRVAPERALYLGLAAVEIITNAIKYSHPAGVDGTISIKIWRTPRSVMIEITDDGVGFPAGWTPDSETGGGGLKIVRSLVNQVGGRIGFDSNDLGLGCFIEMPMVASV